MNKIIYFLISVSLIAISGCNKPEPKEKIPQDVIAQEKQAEVENHSLEEDPVEHKDGLNAQEAKVGDTPESDTPSQEKQPCLQASKPFCKVIETDGECDPKLIEHHYKAGDQLYWINHTQYDTVDCYYTEEEYNKDHDPKDCAELQDEGKGCIIDDSPECNLMLCEDCTVCFTRASCDERLLELVKDVGDRMPGVLIEKDNNLECFYTEEERDQFLKKNKLECESESEDEENICTAVQIKDHK